LSLRSWIAWRTFSPGSPPEHTLEGCYRNDLVRVGGRIARSCFDVAELDERATAGAFAA